MLARSRTVYQDRFELDLLLWKAAIEVSSSFNIYILIHYQNLPLNLIKVVLYLFYLVLWNEYFSPVTNPLTSNDMQINIQMS